MATPTTTGTEAHATPGFPAFRAETFPSQVIWLALSFGLLYYLMSKIALPRLGGVLENRRQRIAADLDAAAQARAESEAAGAAYEASLLSARENARALAKETQDRLAGEAASERKRLEADLAAKLEASEAAIRTRTADAMSSVGAIAQDAAAAIVERLTGRAPEPGRIQAALSRLPGR